MANGRSDELEKKDNGQQNSLLNYLPFDLRKKIISFLPHCGAKPKKFKKTVYSLLSYNTLFFDINVFYFINATKATHNLLNRIQVENTLSLIRQNPQILFISVEVKDHHGQRLKGKLVQVLASAGEFNPIELEIGDTPYGLVHILEAYFPNRDDFTSQLAERFKPGHEIVTQKRMERIEKAIEVLINDAIENKEILQDMALETLLNLPIARKFRASINPDPNDVVESGLVWDLRIFITFIKLFEEKYEDLDFMWGKKCDFVDALIWSSLQKRSSLPDFEVFKKGIYNVKKMSLPDRLDLAVDNSLLSELGITHFFGFYGLKKCQDVRFACRTEGARRMAPYMSIFEKYIKLKHQHIIDLGTRKSNNLFGKIAT